MNNPRFIQTGYGVNAVLLGLSIFLFFATFSYWFIEEDSSASVVNILLRRVMVGAFSPDITDYQVIEKRRWVIFVAHLIVTSLGLLLYYKSDISQWLGNRISIHHSVAGFFYKRNELARNITKVFKALIGLLILYTLYTIVINIIGGDFIPRTNFTTFIFLFLIASSAWFIAYPIPDELPNAKGNVDNRNNTQWIRLCDKQHAYVQDRLNKDIWTLYRSKKEVDLSYTEAYFFYEDSFTHYMQDRVVSEDIIGTLKYSLRVAVFPEHLPEILSTDELQKFYNRFTSEEELEKMIFLYVNTKDLLQKARQETFKGLNNYYNTEQNIFSNEGGRKQQDFDSILSNYANYSDISGEISIEIKNNVQKNFNFSNLFRIDFEITGVAFNMDEMLRQILESRKTTSDSMIGTNIGTQEKILNTGLQVLTTPGSSGKRLDALADFARQMNKAFSGDAVQTNKTLQPYISSIQSPLALASEKIRNAIFALVEGQPDPAALVESVSRSTSFLSDNNIQPQVFLQRFFQKLDEERRDRSEEAFRQLVEDTLTEFIPTHA